MSGNVESFKFTEKKTGLYISHCLNSIKLNPLCYKRVVSQKN